MNTKVIKKFDLANSQHALKYFKCSNLFGLFPNISTVILSLISKSRLNVYFPFPPPLTKTQLKRTQRNGVDTSIIFSKILAYPYHFLKWNTRTVHFFAFLSKCSRYYTL